VIRYLNFTQILPLALRGRKVKILNKISSATDSRFVLKLLPETSTEVILTSEALRGYMMFRGTFQVLECIFRQSMLIYSEGQFKYALDDQDSNLSGHFSPHERLNRISQYILAAQTKLQETHPNTSYGFEQSNPQADLELERWIETFNDLILNTKEYSKQLFGENFSGEQIKRFQSEFVKKVHSRSKYYKLTLSFDESGRSQIPPEQKFYFDSYIYISYAVFEPYFDRLIKEDALEKKLIHSLIHKKLLQDHGHLSLPQSLHSKKLKDRRTNSNRFLKFRQIPFEAGLIDDAFIRFMTSNGKLIDEALGHRTYSSKIAA
jgi:hypothetical protein